MVQQSATESMVMSAGVQVTSDEKPTAFWRRQGLTRRQRRQQQHKGQVPPPVRMQSTQEHLSQKSTGRSLTPTTKRALRPTVLTSTTRGKSRPSRSGEPAFSQKPVRNRRKLELRHFTSGQPSPLLVVPEEASRGFDRPVSSTRVTPLQPQKKRSEQRQTVRNRTMASALYGLRLLILGVGLGAITGTLLSVLDPTSRITAGVSQTATVQQATQQVSSTPVQTSSLKLSQEMMPLKTAVQQMTAQKVGLLPGVFFVDLDTGAYLDINGTATFAAASMIKLPILVAFFQDVDAGKIRLDEMLTLQQEHIAGGSGVIQYQPLGTQLTALEAATKMIIISDNTATNMLIARLGGAAALNQRFQSWGLIATQIHNPLPDLAGTNTTSPRDLANLMALVNQGDLMTLRSRDRLLDIMRRTETNSLLPRGLGKEATIAHKTGDIGSMVGDVGLVDMPSGKRYIAVVMVKRPHNDSRAQDLIRQVSRAAYQQFNQPPVRETAPATIPFRTMTPAVNSTSIAAR